MGAVKFADLIGDRAGLYAGLKQGVLIGVAVLAVTLQPSGSATSRLASRVVPPAVASAESAAPRSAEFGDIQPGPDARSIADWVATSRDNRRLAFAILDKRAAQLYVFDADAHLVGSSRVLLGAAPGDDSVAGIGQRPMDQVRPEEKTTPAGRFVSHPGRNASGEEVIWVDYDAAVSMHRVRPVDPKERRLERLASNDPSQRRISYGCINVPVAFFNSVIQPLLGAQRGVIYVLPESKGVRQVFARAYPVDPELHRM
jgi:hypothetical protein